MTTETHQPLETTVTEHCYINHHDPEQIREAGYSEPVADCGDDLNPAAHGGVTVTERCRRCGRERRININGDHREASWWRDPATGDPDHYDLGLPLHAATA